MNQVLTKEALLHSAELLFIERGFHAVSTREIAEHAGVNLAAIQYHYGSKENLFIAAVHSLWSKQCDSTPRKILAESCTEPSQAARILGCFVASFLDELLHTSSPQPCRLMFREIFASGDDSPMVRELIEAVVQEFIAPLDASLLELFTRLNSELDEKSRQFLANTLIAQCFFYMTHKPFLKLLRGVDYCADADFIDAVHAILQSTCAAANVPHSLAKRAQEEAKIFYLETCKNSKDCNDSK